MDFKTLNLILSDLLKRGDSSSNFPIMIRGRHGIGKSEVVYQLAATLGMKVVERRASQMQEGDLIGMPRQEPVITDQGTEVATFNSFDWLVECCENPRVLFFDEVDRGDQQVRQGIMELTDSRKLFGKVLHPETIIIAAVNGGKHGSEYQVGELDPAEADRWAIYDVEPTVEDWLDWANGKVNPLMWDFINQNRDHLEHKDSFEPNEVYPSRRSVVRLDRVLERASLYDSYKENVDHMTNIAMGFLGMGTALAFGRFAANYEYQVTAENIVYDGLWEKTKGFGLNDHLAMTVKISNSGILDKKLSPEHLENVANYFVTLPSEVGAKFWVLFCGKAQDNFQNPNLVEFSNTTARNGLRVSEHYSQMLTGNVLKAKED